MFRFIEDWKIRKRIKVFLAKDPGYLTFEQQVDLGLMAPHQDWAPDFLLGGALQISTHGTPAFPVGRSERLSATALGRSKLGRRR